MYIQNDLYRNIKNMFRKNHAINNYKKIVNANKRNIKNNFLK